MAILQVLVGLGYPILVYLGLTTMQTRHLAIGLLCMALLRVLVVSPKRLVSYTRSFWLPVVGVAAVALGAAVWDHPLSLLLAPTLVNLALLFSFAITLWQDESMVEHLARLQVGELSRDETTYCRRVTVLWCTFFAANGALALWLALGASLEVWVLYTGLVAYLLMGALFTLELAYRHWRFRRYVGAPTDFVFRRIFPPDVAGRKLAGRAHSVAVGEGRSGDGGSGGRPIRLAPEILSRRIDPERREFDLRIPEELDCWPGHFPGQPIVPGVLQLDWVMAEVAEWTGGLPELDRIEVLKFKRPLLPGQEITLHLDAADGLATFRFTITHGGEIAASGRIVLASGSEPT